jgi:D-alanine--poly(phosphoribitol) ligase subunit 1
MGCHIELEEVEHALDLLPDVAQVAVVYHRTNAAYGKLIGSVASAVDLGEKALQTGFAQRLSDYMIPGRILVREHLPKNANSKVDRQRLKAQISENST